MFSKSKFLQQSARFPWVEARSGSAGRSSSYREITVNNNSSWFSSGSYHFKYPRLVKNVSVTKWDGGGGLNILKGKRAVYCVLLPTRNCNCKL